MYESRTTISEVSHGCGTRTEESQSKNPCSIVWSATNAGRSHGGMAHSSTYRVPQLTVSWEAAMYTALRCWCLDLHESPIR